VVNFPYDTNANSISSFAVARSNGFLVFNGRAKNVYYRPVYRSTLNGQNIQNITDESTQVRFFTSFELLTLL